MNALTKAAIDVLAERQRQIEHEHYSHAHDDDEHETGELADAAACYAKQAGRYVRGFTGNSPPPAGWPWRDLDWKPKDARSNLVRAAALILAEIERLDRAAGTSGVKTVDGGQQ